jgi:hypothetical protein
MADNITGGPFRVAVIFGEEDVALYADNADPASLETYAIKSFVTQAELDAYMQGVEDGNGWLNYATRDPDAPRFEVATYSLCGGWENVWTVTGGDDVERPMTFETREAAQAELDQHLAETKLADMDHSPDEFMIREVP